VENGFKSVSEGDKQQQEHEQSLGELTAEEIFEGLPPAPDTEAMQQHTQLFEPGDLTEEEKAELDELFSIIYAQILAEAYKKSQANKPFVGRTKLPSSKKRRATRQGKIALALGFIEILWVVVTMLHCGITFHGWVGCVLVWLCCAVVNYLLVGNNEKKSEGMR
jgi:hypothetical protein